MILDRILFCCGERNKKFSKKDLSFSSKSSVKKPTAWLCISWKLHPYSEDFEKIKGMGKIKLGNQFIDLQYFFKRSRSST